MFGFNRASLGRARNGGDLMAVVRPVLALQSGLARKSEERSPSRTAGGWSAGASIGPRSEERGTGRRFVPAMMIPTSLQSGLARKSEERPAAACVGSQVPSLQSGLARKSEERTPPGPCAMPPAALQSGLARKSEERSAPGTRPTVMGRLQSGLARKSEERAAFFSPAVKTSPGFNRASLGRARNGRCSAPCRRATRASIGPRSEERGTSPIHAWTAHPRLLQSGLARKSEERTETFAGHVESVEASIGPRSEERGTGYRPNW